MQSISRDEEPSCDVSRQLLQVSAICKVSPMPSHALRQPRGDVTSWSRWIDRLYDLKRDKRGNHERPHKPALLLAITDLLDRGVTTKNRFKLDSELIASFNRYFTIVRGRDDKPTIENPFFFLSGDGFWTLRPSAGGPALYQPGNVSRAPTRTALRTVEGSFDPEFFATLLADARSRACLREVLIGRYFPEHRERLAALLVTSQREMVRENRPAYNRVRDGAFRRVVLELYDYRCAACGVRVRLPDDRSLVEAAHIIPFEVSLNDKPNNGLALCPNHHWAMDRYLIAPCPDSNNPAGIWRVGRILDERIDGQKDLVALANRPVIPPHERQFFPDIDALRWRERQLERFK